ncbi:hypothetical protein RHMOL_Rhmol05G0122900 [Rhododendron molle]|uniref:Uncharacterized protein n=1 Tax=Rhododendron molle TaxID=49168 RepID=A0ACC0NN18_RHOML|nr:hypothetical protein RHMOL_Rhmol05G0122900 [Rhododendron molle]
MKIRCWKLGAVASWKRRVPRGQARPVAESPCGRVVRSGLGHAAESPCGWVPSWLDHTVKWSCSLTGPTVKWAQSEKKKLKGSSSPKRLWKSIEFYLVGTSLTWNVDYGASVILAELAVEAGLPKGVLNIVHGTHDIMNSICDDDDIKAVSFVGSDTAGVYVFERASATGKRVQVVADYLALGTNMHFPFNLWASILTSMPIIVNRIWMIDYSLQCNRGAKNHAIVMPDASMDTTLNALVATGFGAAGQRCMAISMVVFVGGSNLWECGVRRCLTTWSEGVIVYLVKYSPTKWIEVPDVEDPFFPSREDKLVELAKSLIVNAGTESDADLGPVISKQAKERLCRLIQSGIDNGAKLALDGRNIVVPRYELGNFIGPTILSDVRVEMECYKEEIFGPVLLCMEADSLEEAINLVNRNKYSSGASIFTTSAAAASKFQSEIEAGQVGINVPVAAPLPFFSNGSKASFSGDLNFSGKAGLHFYTKVKTVTRQWQDFPSSDGVSLGNTESLAFTTSDGSQQIQDA